ncbi:MAG: hypothetical protein U5K00_14175 [Melioribacteraceae bacterium]|nr:hypothetical protein [Melioribacteraceae bacterium]
MKKLLTLVVVLLFASNFFAQELREHQILRLYKEVIKQMLDEVKSSDVKARGMNEILYNKKKELGKLGSDRAQTA